MKPPLYNLIGVDGGASKALVTQVLAQRAGDEWQVSQGGRRSERTYALDEQFAPVPVAEQLAAFRETGGDADRIAITEAERNRGQCIVTAIADAIAKVCDGRPILLGIAMPGLKTSDARGIAVINNGPRMPDFADHLEFLLGERSIELIQPIARIGSDGDYCGLGEESAGAGAFRGVENAYYLGGGTGLAEALKLRGKLVPFDAVQPWMLKAWQMTSAIGPTFEQLASASAMNDRYGRLAGHNATTPEAPVAYPEQAALTGCRSAQLVLDTAAAATAELIVERLMTIHAGRPAESGRGAAYDALKPNHLYTGIVLDRVVLGQQIGRIYADPRFEAVFRQPLDASLTAMLSKCDAATIRNQWLTAGMALVPGKLIPSQLRAAAAMGAAMDALRSCQPTGS